MPNSVSRMMLSRMMLREDLTEIPLSIESWLLPEWMMLNPRRVTPSARMLITEPFPRPSMTASP